MDATWEREKSGDGRGGGRLAPKRRRNDWVFSLGEQAQDLLVHPGGLDIQFGILSP